MFDVYLKDSTGYQRQLGTLYFDKLTYLQYDGLLFSNILDMIEALITECLKKCSVEFNIDGYKLVPYLHKLKQEASIDSFTDNGGNSSCSEKYWGSVAQEYFDMLQVFEDYLNYDKSSIIVCSR